MTRETKIGVIVATSFLLLVGVVVTARMWQGATPVRRYNADDVILKTQGAPKTDLDKTPPAATAQQVNPQPPAPQPTPLNQDIKQAAAAAVDRFPKVSDEDQQRMLRSLNDAVMNPQENVPVPRNPFGDIDLPNPPLAFNDPPAPVPPPTPKETPKPKEKPAPAAKEKPPETPPAPPPLQLDDLPPVPAEPASRTTLPPGSVNPPATPTPPPVNPPAPPATNSTKPPEDSIGLPPPFPPNPLETPGTTLPPEPQAKPKDVQPKDNAPKDTIPLTPIVTPTPKETAPVAFPKDDALPPIQPQPMPVSPPTVPPTGLKPIVNTPMPLPMQEERIPSPPPPPKNPLPVELPAVKPTEPAPAITIRPLPQKTPDEFAPPPSDVQKPAPPIKPQTSVIPMPPPLNNANTNPPTMPPVGFQPTLDSPPIRVPTAPQVRSYDVQDYKVQVGDVSFADISQKVYRSEGYGRALLIFNREYPLAADSFRLDPPQLSPGQVVAVPPLEVLTAKYGTLVGDPGPRPQAAIAANANVEAKSPTSALPPVTPTPKENATIPPTTLSGQTRVAADGSRIYRVGGNGESLLEIARHALGDGRRWAEIYRLNPDIRPEFPIPAGKEIKLPAQ